MCLMNLHNISSRSNFSTPSLNHSKKTETLKPKKMPHVLATLKNIPFETIKGVLENDKAFHASEEMFLEHIWQNVDDENEVLFLFRINSVENTKNLIEKLHTKALEQNPDANLPKMTYLQ
jgi:hypothetical protein